MSKWKIYDKEGNERKVEWLDGSNESVSEYTAPGLEYHGTWMGECFVTLSVKCHVPVDFEIGDYIIYRGEKFVINYNPSVIKKARKGTFGEGFTYDNIKFNALHNELTEIRFLDYVLDDNELHYTSLPEFPFYASSIDDYCDRLQANTNRWCKENGFSGSDYWLFVTPNYERTMQRARTVDGLEDVARETFIREYGSPTTPIFDNKDEKHDVSVSVSSQSIWDSLSLIKSGFGLNFVNRGRAVVIGSAGLPTGHLFKYGKDKGLYEIERVADTEQMVLTKLYAYGSKENMPVRYYATLNQQVFATVTESKNDAKTTGYHFADLVLNLPFRKDYFTKRSVTYPGSDDYPNYIVRVTANDITVKGYVSKDYNSDNCRFYSEYIQADDDRDETNQEAINAFTEAIAIGNTIYFVGGVSKDKFPSEHKDYATSNLPNNMAVSNLMLPGFPNQSLYDWVLAHGGTAIEDEGNSDGIGRAKWTDGDGGEHEAFFSKEQYRPFILSVNHKEFGIREASKVFDGSDDTDEIKPTIEGTGFDVIYDAEMVEDNGVFEDGDDVPTIKLTLPDFGSDFLLDDLITQGTEGGGSPTISMRDGHCGGRSFVVKDAKRVTGGRWEVTCERDYDDLIQLYFPYSYAASHGETPSATEPYQVRKDDHFVLTGIPMTDTYIAANAVKLLAYSLRFLEKNENTRYTYIPRVDELFMARQHDLATLSEGTIRSLHDSIKEGDLLQFVDEDLHIDGSVFIDQLTIKEYGNANIPTYDVTLRDEKQVGSIQRIENKINSLDSFVNSGGGGLSVAQVRALINTYGGSYFLSKLNDDTAAGLITLLKGLKLGSGATYGLDATGDGQLRDLVVRTLKILEDATIGGAIQSRNFVSSLNGWAIDILGNAEFESVKVRSALEVLELLINRMQAQEGDTLFTDNDQIEAVEKRTDPTDGSVSYILSLKEKWEGYITPQQYGNILKGIINTLAAKEAGVSDYEGQTVETDGSNSYYTSWMRVIATHNTDANLGVNQIRVVLYGDTDEQGKPIVPAGKNYEPCQLMTVGRWGCIDYSSEYEGTAEYEAVKRSIEKRQRLFLISTSDGRMMKLTGVDAPILKNGNYGFSLGELPEFVAAYPTVQKRMIPGLDYLYAQGIVVQDFIKIDKEGLPEVTRIDCGEWVDGADLISKGETPRPRYGIYLVGELNEDSGWNESHDVWHEGHKWRCLQHQPVVSSGVQTYYEPKWNSPYWLMIEGNDNLTIEFVSSKGYSFRRGAVDTVITPHLYYGNVDITDDVAAEYWNWTRESESGKTVQDETWDAQHQRQKTLTLTNTDMPSTWSTKDKAIFTCTVTLNDGKTIRIVQNQIIS